MAHDSSRERKRPRSAVDGPQLAAASSTRLNTGRLFHLRSLLREQELLREQKRLLEQRKQLLQRLAELKEQRAVATID
jgi:hypothetical protein